MFLEGSRLSMEFLKTCNTNAQAIVSATCIIRDPITNKQKGNFEAIAYQAFSVTRTNTPASTKLRDWSTSEDIRAVEAGLRDELQLVAQDATRPWLWLFTPTTVDKAAQTDVDLPEPDGYRLQRKCYLCLVERTTNIPQANKWDPSRPLT
jgi:mediator of RNA polymerase II transcription subunit 13